MIHKILFFITVLVSLSIAVLAQGKSQHKVLKSYAISSGGGWDYISVNDGKIYASHGTQVNIIDEKTGDSLGYIPNTTGVHGVAFDNVMNRGYTSNGRLNNVTVFNLKTNEIITQIPTGKNPDAITYENYSKKIITCNGSSKDLSVIDPKSNKVVATIPLDGKPEEAHGDGEGKLYVNIEDKNEIAVVDLKENKVINRFSLKPGEAPTGLAVDTKNKRLYSTCSESKNLIVLDMNSGKLIEKVPIGEGCDGLAFDTKKDMIYTSNGEGTITAIRIVNANTYKVEENFKTKVGARTIAIDVKNHWLFLPTAEFKPRDPNNKNERRQMIPGTFQVLVVE